MGATPLSSLPPDGSLRPSAAPYGGNVSSNLRKPPPLLPLAPDEGGTGSRGASGNPPIRGERPGEGGPPPPDPGSRRAFCKFIRLSDLRGTVSHTRSKPLDIFNYKPYLGSTSISTSPRPPGGGSASPATCAGLRRGLALSRARSSGSCVLTPEPRPGGRQQRGGPKGLKHETAHRGLRSPPATWPGRFQMRGPLGTGVRGTLQRPLWVSLFPPLPGGSRPPHTHIAGDSAASGSWIPARFSCPTHTQD